VDADPLARDPPVEPGGALSEHDDDRAALPDYSDAVGLADGQLGSCRRSQNEQEGAGQRG
jgi:hypothetical protein